MSPEVPEIISGDEKMYLVAKRVLDHALRDPKVSGIMKEMIADEEALDREGLIHTAFAMGVVEALYLVEDGRLMRLSGN